MKTTSQTTEFDACEQALSSVSNFRKKGCTFLQGENKMKSSTISKAVIATALSTMVVVTSAAGASATEFSTYGRVEQPKVSHDFAAGEIGVVNFKTVWGDKDANIESMKEYIDDAHDAGVKILVFPEMCVTGYCSSSDPDSVVYKTAVNLAEEKDGPTSQIFSNISDNYDMWIIYGATEKIEGDSNHAYNSAFVCSPEGEVTTYQKITPVEGDWCTPGETPVLIDAGEYGLMGISICYDTYATPELGRYYAAKGANILVNPTATSRSYKDVDGDGIRDDQGWEWYYKNRLESNASREGYLILSANLVGGDGPAKDDGSYTYNFPGGSVIVGAQFNGPVYYAGVTEPSADVNTNADIVTGQEGLLTNVAGLRASTGSTCTNKDFLVEYYAKWYAELADKMDAGESLKYRNNTTDGPTAAVVNMPGVWGDKEANLTAIENYIKEAGEKGVDILVFPETVLTGYEWKAPEDDPYYQEQGVAMQVALAETVPGPTTNYLSKYAKQYGMYIIFGMTEKEEDPIYDMTDGGVEKVYNSAAILFPDGTIDSYQKMHRAGYESKWSVSGDTPFMFDTQWGKIGIDICRDGHFYPELGRYYAAMGCTMLIHPTATTGNPWYRETRIGSYTDRDGMAAITCNLLGPDGTYDQATDSWTGGIFNSTSLIITKYHNADGSTGFNPVTGSAIDLNGTGSESEGYADRGTSPEGLEIAKMDLSGTGFSISNFNPRLFSKMYDELACLYREGYTSIYSEEVPTEPKTEPKTNPSEVPSNTTPTQPAEVPTDTATVPTEVTTQAPTDKATTSTVAPTAATSTSAATDTGNSTNTTTGNTTTGKVATGDTTSILMLAGLLVASGLVMVTVRKKSKHY